MTTVRPNLRGPRSLHLMPCEGISPRAFPGLHRSHTLWELVTTTWAAVVPPGEDMGPVEGEAVGEERTVRIALESMATVRATAVTTTHRQERQAALLELTDMAGTTSPGDHPVVES